MAIILSDGFSLHKLFQIGAIGKGLWDVIGGEGVMSMCDSTQGSVQPWAHRHFIPPVFSRTTVRDYAATVELLGGNKKEG